MNANVKKYVRERDKMLKKCDIKALRKFVNANKEYYSEEFLREFNNASDDILQITLHKMIVNATKLPDDMRKRSAIWLVAQGHDFDVI